MISLSAGNPAPEAFPAKEIGEMPRTFSPRTRSARYSTALPRDIPLRRDLLAYMQKNAPCRRRRDDILITSGAQQVADLFTKSICNEGDVILARPPSFIGSLNTFRSYKGAALRIPMEPDGISLSNALKREKNVKFSLHHPDFQNSSGITMSL